MLLRLSVVLAIACWCVRVEAQLSPRARMMASGQIAAERLGAQPGRGAPMTVRITGGARRLAALGLSARALSPSVAVVELTPGKLAWLARTLPGQIVVEERRIFHPLLDRAAVAIGAVAARADNGLTGSGVVVGVVDSGFDWHHADLGAADGTSRIAWLLDLSHPPDGRHAELAPFGGLTWDKREIDAALAAELAGTTPAVPVTEADYDGHGTHVASIAASSGVATGRGLPDRRYVGIAPGAELVVAQAGDANGVLSDASVLTACDFVVDRADALGLPLVLNLSLGSEGGAHDGSSNFEVALDELFPTTLPGRALVVAAGNDGGLDWHAGGWSLTNELGVPLQIDGGSADGDVAVELFYRGTMEIAIQAPSGRRSSFIAAGTSATLMFDGEGTASIDNASAGAPPDGLLDIGVDLQNGASGRPAQGAWTIYLRGKAARWDAWLGTGALDGAARFTGQIVSDDHLTVPATATSAIAVGASISRLDWDTIDGRDYMVPDAQPLFIGEGAFFSSAGPSTDGRFVPDVVAPGEYVVAAMSRNATPDMPQSLFRDSPTDLDMLWADDGVHGVLRGTSQAAPMVAGTIALLFQASPTLTITMLREILRTSASPVPDAAGWSPLSGFGQVDVGAAIDLVIGVHGTTPDAKKSTVGVSRDLLPPETEETTIVTVTPRDATGLPLGFGHAVDITLSAGAPAGAVVDAGAGRYERTFVAHAPLGATGVVTATVDGVVLSARPQVFFAPSRTDIGGNFVGGGGCAFGAGNPASPFFVLVVLALLSGVAARRRWWERRFSAIR